MKRLKYSSNNQPLTKGYEIEGSESLSGSLGSIFINPVAVGFRFVAF